MSKFLLTACIALATATAFPSHAEVNDVRIVCDDMDENGCITYYRPHTFRLDQTLADIENPIWNITIPCEDEPFEGQLYDDDQSCWMPKVPELAPFKNPITDSEGVITGILSFSYEQDGVHYETLPLEVKFDCKPKILNVNIKGVEYSEDYNYYRVIYKVDYVGNNYITVSIEGEYNSSIIHDKIYQPDTVEGTSRMVFVDGYSWLTIEVSNKYGHDYVVYEIEPYGENWYELNNGSGIAMPSYNEPEYISSCHFAYDLNGRMIWQGVDLNELKTVDYKGIVIVKSISGKEIKTKKLILN